MEIPRSERSKIFVFSEPMVFAFIIIVNIIILLNAN